MSAWGYGFLENGTASDINSEVRHMIMAGKPLEKVFEEVLKENVDDHAAVYALAYLNLEGERIHTTLKEITLYYIREDIQEGCSSWDEPYRKINALKELEDAILSAKEWGSPFKISY